MPFSDEDLKRLKDYMANVNNGNDFQCMKVDALLSRLEAAEAYINTPSGTCKNCDDLAEETKEQRERYAGWRASRGESWDGEVWRKECGK